MSVPMQEIAKQRKHRKIWKKENCIMAELVREIEEADIPRVRELLALADQGGTMPG